MTESPFLYRKRGLLHFNRSSAMKTAPAVIRLQAFYKNLEKKVIKNEYIRYDFIRNLWTVWNYTCRRHRCRNDRCHHLQDLQKSQISYFSVRLMV